MVAGFIDFLSGVTAGGDGAIGYAGGPVGRAAIIRSGIDMGLSSTSILGAMRGAGLGMRTQNFYQLVQELSGPSTGAGFVWGGPGSFIDPSDIVSLEGGQGGKYMVNVKSYYTSVSEDGELESGYRVTSILQDELDVDQAVLDAQSILGGKYPGADGGSSTITGYDVSSVVQWQGK
jgi:hypothetical protein